MAEYARKNICLGFRSKYPSIGYSPNGRETLGTDIPIPKVTYDKYYYYFRRNVRTLTFVIKVNADVYCSVESLLKQECVLVNIPHY
jgi:hypothetical protein